MFTASLGRSDVDVRDAVSYKPKRWESIEDYVKAKVQIPFEKSNNGTGHSRVSPVTAQRHAEKGEPNQ